MRAFAGQRGWSGLVLGAVCACALAGCTPETIPTPDVSVYPPSGLELNPLSYSDTTSAWHTVSILNQSWYSLDVKDVELRDVSADVAATLPEGTQAGGAAFLEFQGVPTGSVGLVLAPRQSVSLEVRVATATQVPRSLWTSAKYVAVLHFQVGGSGVVNSEDGTVDIDAYRSISKEIDLSFELNCDLDGDGVASEVCGGGDCDDKLAAVGPDEEDVCDGFDNNCSGLIDEGCPDAP